MNRKIDKTKLFKYGEYLKEKLDPWILKRNINSFNKLPDDILTIPGDLKELSDKLTIELNNIELPYKKILNFGGIEINIEIIKSNKYYSNIDWVKFLKGEYEIIVETEKDFDINYIVSTIIHEIRHMIDFTDENLNVGLSSFDIDKNLRKYNINIFNEFFILVYISLEHELVARNNQIYPYIKFKNLSKSDSLNILKKSFIWKALDMLNDFDHSLFISKFDDIELMDITNSFIKECLFDDYTIIENREELSNFYKIWKEYFNETSNKWKDILLKEVDIVYERKIGFNGEFEKYNTILINIWNQIKNKY